MEWVLLFLIVVQTVWLNQLRTQVGELKGQVNGDEKQKEVAGRKEALDKFMAMNGQLPIPNSVRQKRPCSSCGSYWFFLPVLSPGRTFQYQNCAYCHHRFMLDD